ncbi:MAG: DUF120 domain-containing protein [Nitrososphaerales archaeon]
MVIINERKLKPYELLMLLELLKLKAKDGFAQLKTTELGENLGISQQAASVQLKELEGKGLIARKRATGNRLAVKITEKGLGVIGSVYTDLSAALENEAMERKEVVFHGKVFRGLGQASYFIGLQGYRKQCVRLLGFLPYPGTLNLRLESPLEIYQSKLLKLNYDGTQLEGFVHNKKEYAPLKCFKAVVNDSYRAAILYTDRTHYNDSVIEIISPDRLRDKLELAEEDETRGNKGRINVRVQIS